MENPVLPAVARPGYRTHLRQALFAALLGSAGVIMRAAAQPILGDALPFLFGFQATVLAALLWGTFPGIVAAGTVALAVWIPQLPPNIPGSEQAIQYGGFGIAAVVIAIMCGRMRGPRPIEAAAISRRASETSLATWLSALLWGAMFIPLLAFVAASSWSFERANNESTASLAYASNLALRQAQRAFAVAHEIAIRADGASQLPDDQLRAQEAQLHIRLSDMAAGINSIVNATIWDASGSALARSDVYPVDRGISIADRSYFQQQRSSPVPLAVSGVITGRMTGKQVINATVPRHSQNGSFNGIVSVSLSPSFFSDYYQSLARENPILTTFALIKSDGEILAQSATQDDSRILEASNPLMRAISSGADIQHLSIDDRQYGVQMLVVRRVDNLPLWVVTGVSRNAMLASWGKFVGILAGILAPITAGLVYVTWVALRKTRREGVVAEELQAQIRARADVERRMLEAQRLETLSLVTGSVAHDFNNLLAIITSSLHVHRLRHPETSEEKTLATISRSVQSGVRLTRQLLSYSSKQALRPEIIRFQTWLPIADSLMRSTLGSAATWTSFVADDTKPVKVDAGELELAMINLVLNAKLAMPHGGHLKVHISNDEHAPTDAPMVIVCLVDTGEGIASELLPKVFEPFFTTRQKGVGSGLGLSQVQNFCIQSGGRASIESILGEGTTVCLHLPATNEAFNEVSGAESEPICRLEASLLLVEDNDEVAKITEQMLASSGMTVTRVSSARGALDHLRLNPSKPEIVLSDISMPGEMNGIELALEIERLYPDLPIVLNTGYAEQIEEATSRGMRVFQKPVSPMVLLNELRAMLQDKKDEHVGKADNV